MLGRHARLRWGQLFCSVELTNKSFVFSVEVQRHAEVHTLENPCCFAFLFQSYSIRNFFFFIWSFVKD